MSDAVFRLTDLDTPVLVIDQDALERNIQRMADMMSGTGVAWRPHAKSHKTPIIAEMLVQAGAAGICCAKLGEAEVMAASGIENILITTPVVGPGKLMRLLEAAQHARITVVADHADNIMQLAGTAQTAGLVLDVLVEVDVGQGRCGVPPGEKAAELAAMIADQQWLNFKGLQGYQGAIQMTADPAARRAATEDALQKLQQTAEAVKARGLSVDVLTGGGTGTSAIDLALGGLTELQPGSFIFMDTNYAAIGWPDANAQPFENALTVLGTVISLPDDHRAIIDVGMKAASGDGGMPRVIGHDDATFTFAGDEHGQIAFDGACPLNLGDQVTLVPSHCDTTVNLYDQYIVHRGGEVTAVWEIPARGRVQ